MKSVNDTIITTLDIYFESSHRAGEGILPPSNSGTCEGAAVLDSRTDEEVFADFLKSQEGKYISEEDGKYIISRVINGKRKVIARFTLYEYAAEYERNLIVNGWHDLFNHNNTSSCGKFIRKDYNRYSIIRTIDGEKVNFGSCPTLEEALLKREELIENNWGYDIELNFHRKSKFGKYISYLDGLFKIQKVLDGQLWNYGFYDTIDDAIIARDLLVENNWEDSCIPESLYSWRYFTEYNPPTHSWEIFNDVDGDNVSFGLFKTPEFAKKALRILINNNWDSSLVPLEYYHEDSNIRTFKRSYGNLYSVFRRVNYNPQTFETFDNKADATAFRNDLLLKNWVMEEEDIVFDTYIHEGGNTFSVENDGVLYGEFDRICDASEFVTECVKNNWWHSYA